MYVKSYVEKRCLQQFPKTRMSRSAQMCSGIEFHAAGPACEKARSPNLVRIAAVVRSQSTTLTSHVDPGVVAVGIKRLYMYSGDQMSSVPVFLSVEHPI